MKRKMTAKLYSYTNESDDSADNCVKKIVCIDFRNFCDKEIDYFISPQSLNFFDIFEIKKGFLHIDPQEWPLNADYNEGLDIVRKLKVVNDTAERAVKLVTRLQ